MRRIVISTTTLSSPIGAGPCRLALEHSSHQAPPQADGWWAQIEPAVALNCDIVEVVRRAQKIAGDRDVQIISADIARQALEHDLIDELQVFVAPVFLGNGTRIFDVPGERLRRLLGHPQADPPVVY